MEDGGSAESHSINQPPGDHFTPSISSRSQSWEIIGVYPKLLSSSDPHQLTFYLTYILTYMLTCILAFNLAFSLTYIKFRHSILNLFDINMLAFYLTLYWNSVRRSIPTFFLGILSDISSSILPDILSGIFLAFYVTSVLTFYQAFFLTWHLFWHSCWHVFGCVGCPD